MTEQEIADAAARIPPARLLELMGYEPRLGWMYEEAEHVWKILPFIPMEINRPIGGKAVIVFDF
jgi:hypothetical protein